MLATLGAWGGLVSVAAVVVALIMQVRKTVSDQREREEAVHLAAREAADKAGYERARVEFAQHMSQLTSQLDLCRSERDDARREADSLRGEVTQWRQWSMGNGGGRER